MNRRPIATLIASIILAGLSVSPATAEDSHHSDAAGFAAVLLGIGALIALGEALSSEDTTVSDNHMASPRHQVRHDRGRHDWGKRHHHREFSHRNARRTVPSFCLRQNRWNNGPRRFYSYRCLANNMRNFHRLPHQCATLIQTYHGYRNVYSARCLRHNGWISG